MVVFEAKWFRVFCAKRLGQTDFKKVMLVDNDTRENASPRSKRN